MSFPDSFTPHPYFDEEQYRRTLVSGIAAVKSGELDQARKLLKKAAEMKSTDPQPWLWLSATTADLAERREYLEYALAADPNNGAARRGLIYLSEQLDKTRLLDVGEDAQPQSQTQPLPAQVSSVFICERCGGRMAYDVSRQALVCEYCGNLQNPDIASVADQDEQVFDFVLPTTRGHLWAEAQHQLTCQQCGAVTVLAAAERATICPHCGSPQLLESTETKELITPNVIAPPKLSLTEASTLVQAWLGKGWFIPDDLKKLAKPSALRPVYYPFWTFDGILQMDWSCIVNRGTAKNPIWMQEQGVEFEIFDDELVAGVTKLDPQDAHALEPLDMKSVVAYDATFLAGWNVLAYDKSLAQASLDAREKVAKRLRNVLSNRVLLGQEKRNLQSGATNWSGLTFKLALFPFYVGSYRYRGVDYQLYVNGQNGKVSGMKPVDRLKRGLFWLTVILGGFVVLLIIFLIALNFGWIRF
ncbi:MAG: hypothetical protein ACPL4H_08245 [Anaerolineales bacterium]